MNRGHVPMRKCVGCMVSKPKSELIRIGIESETGCGTNSRKRIVIDEDLVLTGRGAYLCRSSECFETARKRRSINRTLKREVTGEDYERIGEYFEKL